VAGVVVGELGSALAARRQVEGPGATEPT
jgi:hypothetical protein